MDAPTERGLLDTNLVIRLRHVDPDDLSDEPLVSVVTIAELHPEDFAGINSLDLRPVEPTLSPAGSES